MRMHFPVLADFLIWSCSIESPTSCRISLDLYSCTAVQLYTVPLYSCDLEFTLLLRSWWAMLLKLSYGCTKMNYRFSWSPVQWWFQRWVLFSLFDAELLVRLWYLEISSINYHTSMNREYLWSWTYPVSSSDIAKIRIPGITPERGFYYRFRRLDLPPIIVYY